MACRYYDDAIRAKLQKWIPSETGLRILKPDETRRLFELKADDNADKEFKLPFIALSRNNELELLSTSKQPRSFDGLKILDNRETTVQLNILPIQPEYQLDIYTKRYDDCDEYMRDFLFKLINNPVIKIDIPYNGVSIQHIANIHVLSPLADNSSISERLFSGQFTRMTIQFEIQDAFLFSVPYRKNWKLYLDEDDPDSVIELSNDIREDGEQEELGFEFRKY